jgi:hypothetical protein
MSLIRGRALPVLLAAAVIVGGANLAAYAANGGVLVLGHKNSATKSTTLKNSKGTALSLKSKTGTAPLKVSNSEKIAKLNADQLDGLDGASLQNHPYVITLSGSVAASAITFPITGVPAGDYQVTYNVSATVGGAAAYFGCYLVHTAAPTAAYLPQIGASPAPGTWYVSSAGTYHAVGGGAEILYCTTSGTSIAVPALPVLTSQIVFTRIDGSTPGVSTGARTSSRSAFR